MASRLVGRFFLSLLAALTFAGPGLAQQDGPPAGRQPPLGAEDIGDIARLLMLEDTRNYDEAALARALKSEHPEVRRRAAVAIGRIASRGGLTLLTSARGDKEPEIQADRIKERTWTT